VKTFGGAYQNLIITPNDWALDNKTVTFHVAGLKATETAIYNADVLGGTQNGRETVNLTFPALPAP
jgi:hypothetical protein